MDTGNKVLILFRKHGLEDRQLYNLLAAEHHDAKLSNHPDIVGRSVWNILFGRFLADKCCTAQDPWVNMSLLGIELSIKIKKESSLHHAMIIEIWKRL